MNAIEFLKKVYRPHISDIQMKIGAVLAKGDAQFEIVGEDGDVLKIESLDEIESLTPITCQIRSKNGIVLNITELIVKSEGKTDG